VPAGRLEDHAANGRIALEGPLHQGGIIGRDDHRLRRHLGRDARDRPAGGRAVGAGDQEVVPAVEVTGELEHAGPAGGDPRQPQGHHGRLGARRHEADALGAGHQPLHPGAPFDLPLVTGADVRAVSDLAAHGLHDGGVAVPQQQGAVAGPVVDQVAALDRSLVAALGVVHIHGERLEVAQVVRDAAGKDPASTLVELARLVERGGVTVGQGTPGHGGGRHEGRPRGGRWIPRRR
jgi:hypothetical protein